MAFLEADRRSGGGSGTKYLKIVSGVPVVIQLLDEHPVLVEKHWITDGAGRKVGLRCPGEDSCPICQRNRGVGFNRDHPDFIQRSRRYRVNVLDMTPVRHCTACDAVYVASGAPDTCTACSSPMATEDVPLLAVKILERGRRLMEKLHALESAPHPFVGKMVSLQSYPIMLIATGSGREMDITPVPQVPQEIDIDAYERFDLKSGLILTTEEIQYLLDGGVYKDILENRRASEQVSQEPTKAVPF